MKDGNGQLIYISGSITGATAQEKALFGKVETELVERGYTAFNPPQLPDASLYEDSWAFALCRDVSIITSAYGIAVLPTYTRSKGALFEIFTAITLHKKLVFINQFNQDLAWHNEIMGQVQQVQSVLWRNVDRVKFAHHRDIPHD